MNVGYKREPGGFAWYVGRLSYRRSNNGHARWWRAFLWTGRRDGTREERMVTLWERHWRGWLNVMAKRKGDGSIWLDVWPRA